MTDTTRSTDIAGFLRTLQPDGVREIRTPKCPDKLARAMPGYATLVNRRLLLTACGHWVDPLGADGSEARERQRRRACAACKRALPGEFRCTDEMLCPHCGESQSNPEEHFGRLDEETDTDCGHCGKAFRASRTVSVHYNTEPS